MCLTNIHMKEFFSCVIFVVKISKKLKKNLKKKKKKFSDSLQNLMQYRGPIGA